MMRGDARILGITLKKKDGTYITTNNCEDVEITVGKLIKTYSDEKITFANNKWFFKITQQESFAFKGDIVPVQARVKIDGDYVGGIKLGFIEVEDSLSKEVL